jgi:2-polyprenyl-6-methoxyphenol hydroxylase-like FAD-dependent oxidoreductase
VTVDRNQTDVFIVGGGPVGLAMALLLHRFEIPCVVVEKNETTTDHPKSRGCFARTMELFRQWGVEDAIRARGLVDRSDVFVFSESVAGREIGRTLPEPNLEQGPSWKSMVAQDAVEEELLNAVRDSKFATIRYSTEWVALEQDGDRVRVEIRDVKSGRPEQWEAKYLIAADGAGSPVRRAIGIDLVGPATLRYMLNEYWRGDMSRFRVARDATGIRILPRDRSQAPAQILNTNGRDRWLTLMVIGRERDERPRPLTDAETIAEIRRHVGAPDQEVELINRSTWRFSKQVASTFRKGRVFLAGDSAHRFPPTGGMGLNSGVQDAHNLAWKLAFVLKGLASERLLDSYDPERRPVAQSNADWSYGNYLRFFHIEEAMRSDNEDEVRFWLRDMDNHIHSIGQVLGFRYDEGAVVWDGSTRHPLDPRRYVPTDQPGCRFPHMWLNNARTVTTLDWFDKHLALVGGPAAEPWLEAGAAVSERLGVPIDVHRLPAADAAFGFAIGSRGAALVRPDGHVAFRMPWTPSDPARELATALTAILK